MNVVVGFHVSVETLQCNCHRPAPGELGLFEASAPSFGPVETFSAFKGKT